MLLALGAPFVGDRIMKIEDGMYVSLMGMIFADYVRVYDAFAKSARRSEPKISEFSPWNFIGQSRGGVFHFHYAGSYGDNAKLITLDELFADETSTYDGTTLPPVGTVCHYKGGLTSLRKGVIKCHLISSDGLPVAVIAYDKGYDVGLASLFRPIKSDRDKVIDDMGDIYYKRSECSSSVRFGALYDAGYRKVEL
jgi:hypothetical protein